MKRTWTEHKLTDNMLKQLAGAISRDDGSMYPGIGYGAPSGRSALETRGLCETIVISEDPATYHWAKPRKNYGTYITAAGREAFAQAREEGW